MTLSIEACTFRTVVRRNVVFTAICSLSSMFTLLILSDTKTLVPLFVEYIFLITNIDMTINTSFLFGTFTPNRTAIAALCRKCCRCTVGAIGRTSDKDTSPSVNTTNQETGTYGVKAVQMHGGHSVMRTPLSVDTLSISNTPGDFPIISEIDVPSPTAMTTNTSNSTST